jgi:hypothetical protein
MFHPIVIPKEGVERSREFVSLVVGLAILVIPKEGVESSSHGSGA